MIEISRGGADLVPEVAGLWLELFDHHLSIGAAGLATIDRDRSWPLREAHYLRLFARQPRAGLWIARHAGAAVGYALAFEDRLDGERAWVLETLSVLPGLRGAGIGSRLMRAVDDAARTEGIDVSAVEVMGGNPRARDLYLRAGYEPRSETWMRSEPPADPDRPEFGWLPAEAERLGIEAVVSNGPDDTWISADRIVDLSPGSGGFDADALAALLDRLAGAGLWTVRIELPAAPGEAELRELLAAQGFRLSTERLVREY